MTKKDYELIAGAIKRSRGTWTPPLEADTILIEAVYTDIVRTVSEAMSKDNSRFNRDIFMKACK